ncbi:MAG: hypothetical protein R3362_03395 [Rhodothermales bacterium]|nr:hypothetical protein [Rhodothermales bacterium]
MLIVPAANAQDYPTTGVSMWQCDFAHMGEFVESVNTYMQPAAQAMVDEGSLINWGMLTHQWGDEWNVVFYTTAADTEAFLAANEELNRRTTENVEAAGEDPEESNPFMKWCSAHRDNIYTHVSGAAPGMVASTEMEDGQ